MSVNPVCASLILCTAASFFNASAAGNENDNFRFQPENDSKMLSDFKEMELHKGPSFRDFIRGRVEVNGWRVDRKDRSLDYKIFEFKGSEFSHQFNLSIGQERQHYRVSGELNKAFRLHGGAKIKPDNLIHLTYTLKFD